MIFVQYLCIFKPSFFFFFLAFIYISLQNLNQWHDTRIHNSKEHALKNTSVLCVACNTYTRQMFSVLQKLVCLNFLLQLNNIIKYICHFKNMFDAKSQTVWLWPALEREMTFDPESCLTGSVCVELCRTLERTTVKILFKFSSFFSTHINVAMWRSGTRLHLVCIAVDFCLCIDLHWAWLQ